MTDKQEHDLVDHFPSTRLEAECAPNDYVARMTWVNSENTKGTEKMKAEWECVIIDLI
jgi:hypothetical protein